MTVKELKKVIETLPDDFEIVISTDIGYSSKVVHFFGILEG